MNTKRSMIRPQSGAYPKEHAAPLAPSPRLAAFVYGTLKSGQKNHAVFCGNALDIRPATTIGRLYALPAGYPALIVPEQLILAHGTADPLADAALQVLLAATMDLRRNQAHPCGDWDVVHGELIELADPLRSLPPLDRLEGFRPGGPSLYQRILLPVLSGRRAQLCWTYIMPGCSKSRRLRDGIWLPKK